MNGSSTRFEPVQKKRIMAVGTVKWFNATKGFAFMTPAAPTYSCISAQSNWGGTNDLKEGQKIEYEAVADSAPANTQRTI
jgi:CspA family cold shock protein